MNELLLESTITAAIEDYEEQTAEPPPDPPKIIHHAIDDQLQTGDSRLLGGAMQIRAPWLPPENDP